MIPSWKAPNPPQTDILDTLNLANTYGIDVGKAVGGNMQKMGPRGASGGGAAAPPQLGPNSPNFGVLPSLGL
jgi:hypothetical protein